MIGDIAVDHVDSSIKCHTLPGSKSLHSISSFSIIDPTLLTCELSCFCFPCIDGDWARCENFAHVQEWLVQRLQPFSAIAVAQQIEEMDNKAYWVYDGISKEVGNLVEIGDNFIIPAEEGNEDGVEYYILQCVAKKFVLQESMTCP